MKLIKAIKLHWKLRVRQEYAFNKVCEYSQKIPFPSGISPHLPELSSVNKAVRKVESFIPGLYFIISDIFGGTAILKKHCRAYYIKKEREENERINQFYERILKNLICYDLIADPGFYQKNTI